MLQYNTKPKLTSRRKDTTRNRYKDYSSTSHSTNYIHNYNNNSSRCPYGNKYYNVIPLHSILALLLVGMIGNACGYYDTYATNGNIDDSIKNSTSIENEEENSTITIDNSNSNDDIGGERGEGV